jgi:hypothetical protein
MSQNMRLSGNGVVFMRFLDYTRNIMKNALPNRKGKNMTVSVATYKVGDLYTSQKSKVTGTILEIAPTDKETVRVKLDVNGNTRWTTWKAQS